MTAAVVQRVNSAVVQAAQLYHRLVLVVGTTGSGKTAVIRAAAGENDWPVTNLNLELTRRLLELTVRQRALRVGAVIRDLVAEAAASTVAMDNIEMLFHPELQNDPLRLLQALARNRTIVASWPGRFQAGCLQYAEPGHPEFRSYRDPEALIVCTEEADPSASPQSGAARQWSQRKLDALR